MGGAAGGRAGRCPLARGRRRRGRRPLPAKPARRRRNAAGGGRLRRVGDATRLPQGDAARSARGCLRTGTRPRHPGAHRRRPPPRLTGRGRCHGLDVPSDLHERRSGRLNPWYTREGSSPSPRTAFCARPTTTDGVPSHAVPDPGLMRSPMVTSYTAESITVLEGLEAVRKRPSMYIGSTGPKGLHHLVYEVVDNAVDEALAGYCTRIDITLTADGGVRVVDNGRGIPVDEHPIEHRSALEVVMTTLHAGGKFGGDSYAVSGGLHGVGVSVVNALSTRHDAEVVRDGYRYRQSYERGEPTGPVERVGKARGHGTTVAFWPDPDIFEDLDFSFAILSGRMREMAFLNAGLSITLTDERDTPAASENYMYKGGLRDFVAHLNSSKEPVHPSIIYYEGEAGTSQAEIAMQWNSSYNDSLYTFANTNNTVDGGTHEEGFRAALTSP